jgi:uncharacterized repeat protein (TIGR02543 family)
MKKLVAITAMLIACLAVGLAVGATGDHNADTVPVSSPTAEDAMAMLAGTSISGTVDISVDADLDVGAGEPVNTYNLTVNVSPADSGTVVPTPSCGTYPEGKEVTLVAIPARGYTFDNWTGDASGTARCVRITMDENKCVTANFSPVVTYSLTVTVNPADAGMVIQIPQTCGDYREGKEVTLVAIPAHGYTFDNWTGDASGSTRCVRITMDEDKSVTANFSPAADGGLNFTLDMWVDIGLDIAVDWS